MISWKEISGLHVIKRFEEIIGHWFGVDMYLTDEHFRIQSGLLEKNHDFKSLFTKVQLSLNYGNEYLGQDVEKVVGLLENSNQNNVIFSGFFDCVQGIASKIIIEGQYCGTVISYPFIKEQTTSQELEALKVKLIECGANETDATHAVENLKKISDEKIQYLCALNDLIADEIISFHQEIQKREERITELNSELGNKYRYHSMIGKSKKMQLIYRLLEKITNSEATCLIQGENGTGKELVAKAIHYGSPRKDSPFFAQNCSAFNDNLLDSELFGHVKGAFTGAIKDKKGIFEVANGGTLFLDEIGDTSPTMQVKLLRVLQEGTFLPVGATTPRRVDVRIITATNRNLKEMISAGEFREDLYYRINVINIQIPALRERKEDIPLLVEHFLEARCAELGKPTKTISKKCLERLLDYAWPGNIRELENEIERLVVLAGDSKIITPDFLSPRISEDDHSSNVMSGVKTTGQLKDALEELEAFMIREGLKRCNFNKSKLAKELGISRAGLIMKVEKYALDKRKKAIGE